MEVNNSGFWDVAYRDNAPSLLGVLRRYVKDVSVAQDLLHEVFITAIEKYDSFTGKGSFEGWLYRIAVNTALMYLRNKQAEMLQASSLQLMDADDSDDDDSGSVRSTIEAAGFTSEELLSAIDRLPEHHKLVFNMYVMDDFSHKQIAAELNISAGTSKSHLARARKKIQQFLYEDAMNRKKKKDRRWASAFLLLFPAKEHYIDRMYRDGLSNFALPPVGGAEFLPAALEQHIASVGSVVAPSAASVATQTVTTVTFWGSKLSYMVLCCGTAAITGTVSWMAMGDNSPFNAQFDKNEPVIVGDTLKYLPELPTPVATDTANYDLPGFENPVGLDSEKNLPGFENPAGLDSEINLQGFENPAGHQEVTAPVVVKKQIIQRQTVVLRDTLFILE